MSNEIAATIEQIEKLQAIQKTHPQTSSAWMQASELLQPLFAKMKELTKPNGYIA